MIAYMPEPYDDELISSWLLRMFAYGPYAITNSFRELVFRRVEEAVDYLFYNGFTTELAGLIDRRFGWSTFVNEHTLVPYYQVFLSPEHQRAVVDAVENRRVGVCQLVAMPLERKKIRFCPKCVAEMGEPFLTRTAQLPYLTVCPKHRCRLIETEAKVNKECFSSLSFPAMPIPDKIEYVATENVEYRFGKYASEFLNQSLKSQIDIPIGTFLTHRLDGTKYISFRGGQRNITMLMNDIKSFYAGTDLDDLTEWRTPNLFRNRYVNTHETLLISFFLGISVNDLIERKVPDETHTERIDAAVKKLYADGNSFCHIAKMYNIDCEVIRKILIGGYKKSMQ